MAVLLALPITVLSNLIAKGEDMAKKKKGGGKPC